MMAALYNRANHYILVLWFSSSFFFFFLSIFFYSSPILSRRRLDVYHTSTNAKNRQKFAIWAPSHNFVGLYLHN